MLIARILPQHAGLLKVSSVLLLMTGGGRLGRSFQQQVIEADVAHRKEHPQGTAQVHPPGLRQISFQALEIGVTACSVYI